MQSEKASVWEFWADRAKVAATVDGGTGRNSSPNHPTHYPANRQPHTEIHPHPHTRRRICTQAERRTLISTQHPCYADKCKTLCIRWKKQKLASKSQRATRPLRRFWLFRMIMPVIEVQMSFSMQLDWGLRCYMVIHVGVGGQWRWVEVWGSKWICRIIGSNRLGRWEREIRVLCLLTETK